MTRRELERVGIIREVMCGQITQRQGGERLGVCIRQVKRLCKLVREEPGIGLVSKRRGLASNHQLDSVLKQEAIRVIREQYGDFGPTLACEKLAERHDLHLSKETVRKLMITEGLWRAKHRRSTAHPRRERRARRGELLQMDASLHDWLEDRGPRLTLVATIDDASGEVMGACFVAVEDTWAYFELLYGVMMEHGRPLQIYTDRHSIFRPVVESLTKPTAETQFARALRELDIELICANSPQAKGRVERLFGTLQDRLVKELRLENVCTLEAANVFLPGYLTGHNRAFSVVPATREGAMRPLSEALRQEMEFILCRIEERQLSKVLTLQFEGELFQIETNRPEYALRHKKVQIVETRDRRLQVRYQGQLLRHKIIMAPSKQARIADSKQIASGCPTRNVARAPASAGLRRSMARAFTRKPQPLGNGL